MGSQFLLTGFPGQSLTALSRYFVSILVLLASIHEQLRWGNKFRLGACALGSGWHGLTVKQHSCNWSEEKRMLFSFWRLSWSTGLGMNSACGAPLVQSTQVETDVVLWSSDLCDPFARCSPFQYHVPKACPTHCLLTSSTSLCILRQCLEFLISPFTIFTLHALKFMALWFSHDTPVAEIFRVS